MRLGRLICILVGGVIGFCSTLDGSKSNYSIGEVIASFLTKGKSKLGSSLKGKGVTSEDEFINLDKSRNGKIPS
jgi:hypothetical protein